jgi:hypothetical protein
LQRKTPDEDIPKAILESGCKSLTFDLFQTDLVWHHDLLYTFLLLDKSTLFFKVLGNILHIKLYDVKKHDAKGHHLSPDNHGSHARFEWPGRRDWRARLSAAPSSA